MTTRLYTCALLIAALSACGSSDNGPKKVKPEPSDTSNNVTGEPNDRSEVTVVDNGDGCVNVTPVLRFDAVQVGDSASDVLMVSNCGDSTISLGLVDILSPFYVEFDGGSVAPGESVQVEILFVPTSAGSQASEVAIETSVGTLYAEVRGDGVEATTGGCPTSIARGVSPSSGEDWSASFTAMPGASVELTASASSAESEIVAWQWAILSRPADSTASLSPSNSVEDPNLFLDAVGVYEIEMFAFTEAFTSGCAPGRMTIDTRGATDEFVVELTWDTPGDSNQTDTFGTDLDLHYLAPGGTWNASPYDAYWQNPEADWGSLGVATVERDDSDGAGPETLRHANASSGEFQVGVYYYADNSMGTSDATVRVYRGETLLKEASRAAMQQQNFWTVGRLDVSAGVVTTVNTVSSSFPQSP